MEKNPNKNWPLLICLVLTLTTLAVYYQVHSFGFINLDDPVYVSENPNIQAGITLNAVKWAFTSGYAGNWHPLTWLSHILDWQFFGSNPAGHHLTNLFFHIANTLLLFLVLKKMTESLWQSAFVAALFALHPLHVESVAWVAERKDVLSIFFWLLTMWAYVRYVKNPKLKWYLISLMLFALGLMAKPMLVTLPFVLLLLDYWPLNRISRFNWQTIYRLILEKIPFFFLAAVLSVITFIAQHNSGAISSLTGISIKSRVCNALISYVQYIEKMFWPTHLAFFYPYPAHHISISYAMISAGFLLAVTIFILLFSKKHRYLFTGWFWYLGTLLPVIGLVQVGSQAMADRYTYITLTGLFIIIAWGLPELLEKLPYRKIVLWILSLVVLFALTVCAYLQTRYWKDTITLCRHALEVTKDNNPAHFCMVKPLLEQNRIDVAVLHGREAVRINPYDAHAIDVLGSALYKQGKIDDAVRCFRKVLDMSPGDPKSNLNLAAVLVTKGSFTEAVAHYRIAGSAVNTPGMHGDFGYALTRLGQFRQAAEEYRKACSADSNDPNTLNDFGFALAHSGEYNEAISLYNKALQIAPDAVNIHLNLGFALIGSGRLQEAVKEYGKILLAHPDNVVAHNDLGIALANQGNFDDAIAHFNQAVKINPNYTEAKNNLSAVLAEKQKSQNAEKENTKK